MPDPKLTLPHWIRAEFEEALDEAVRRAKSKHDDAAEMRADTANRVLQELVAAAKRAHGKKPRLPADAEEKLAAKLKRLKPLAAFKEVVGLTFAKAEGRAWPAVLRSKLVAALAALPAQDEVTGLEIATQIFDALDGVLSGAGLPPLPRGILRPFAGKIANVSEPSLDTDPDEELWDGFDPAHAPALFELVLQFVPATWTNDVPAGLVTAPARAWSLAETFTLGEVIQHPLFGAGVVVAVKRTRLDVRFADGVRKLAHGQSPK